MANSIKKRSAGSPGGLLGGELRGDGAHGAQVGAQPLAGLLPRRSPLRQPRLCGGNNV